MISVRSTFFGIWNSSYLRYMDFNSQSSLLTTWINASCHFQLQYSILSGNKANLVYLNESTGLLTLSPYLDTNVPLTGKIEILVSGKHTFCSTYVFRSLIKRIGLMLFSGVVYLTYLVREGVSNSE